MAFLIATKTPRRKASPSYHYNIVYLIFEDYELSRVEPEVLRNLPELKLKRLLSYRFNPSQVQIGYNW
jgi:hypothetical protein